MCKSVHRIGYHSSKIVNIPMHSSQQKFDLIMNHAGGRVLKSYVCTCVWGGGSLSPQTVVKLTQNITTSKDFHLFY